MGFTTLEIPHFSYTVRQEPQQRLCHGANISAMVKNRRVLPFIAGLSAQLFAEREVPAAEDDDETMQRDRAARVA